ncbi:MAG: arylesterase, partial [Bacteriovoracaceae bacterium]|nr:arylesterase [Bacteriovoracaceae bacterium]
AYPSLLEKKLLAEKYDIKVINAGVSGSTTASASQRLAWYLKAKPEILLLALGANDGLRGLKITESQKNLEQVIEKAQASGTTVILAGMLLPPNYGKEYSKQFEQMFKDLAKKYSLSFIPFLLKGVGGEKKLNIEDGMHPNENGHKKILETVYPYIVKAL